MGNCESVSSMSSTRVRWMWNCSADPFAEPVDWSYYSDVENIIIEEAFTAGKTLAILDKYHIDLKNNLQISNDDIKKQRLIKRQVCSNDERILRPDRYLPNPVAPDLPYNGSYGYISIFVKEVAKHLNITREQLPSKNKSIIPMIVEQAALGIIEEGINVGEQCNAEWLAGQLRQKKNRRMKVVWRECANLYTLESFLYKKLNETMRLIGDKEHEQKWRSKISTLGPFCLLLWDNPFDSKMLHPGTILYRGVKLNESQIIQFRKECSNAEKRWHTFQAFTSCSRNREVSETFGNALFIMKTRLAFTVDLCPHSAHPKEEEELLYPGVSFTVDKVESDGEKGKASIYITLQQLHNSKLI